jgi:hypothetical protein
MAGFVSAAPVAFEVIVSIHWSRPIRLFPIDERSASWLYCFWSPCMIFSFSAVL